MARTYDKSDLEAAIRVSGITDAAATRIRTAINTSEESRHDGAALPWQEQSFRYSFASNTVMPALGLIVLLVGLSLASTAFLFEAGGLPAIIVALWLSAYYRDRRNGLAQSILFAGFIVNVAMTALHLALFLGEPNPDLTTLAPDQGALVAGLCATACFAYWQFFRFPLSFALGCVATLTLGDHVLHAFFATLPSPVFVGWPIMFAIIMLTLAVWWDMTDVYRETVRSDVAFWLHLIASFMLLSGLVVAMFASETSGFTRFGPTYEFNAITRVTGLLIFFATIALTVLSLMVNRVVLALFATLFLSAAVHAMLGMENLPFTVLLVGAGIVLLAAFWRDLRRVLLASLPPIVRAQLPREASRIDGRRPVD
ncbi:MAG: hypothetical protein WBA51_18290 [Erythrobacter sp.]